MERLPTLFISHGSPMLAIAPSPAHQFLSALGRQLPRPDVIVVASAHWEALGGPAVTATVSPETVHDFGGFPRALFALRYPAPGAPATAARLATLLERGGFAAQSTATRGLDHGAWVPLSLMYPQADIPVVQVSLLRGASPADHYRLGAALRALRDEGVLVIGSGSLTHNLREYFGNDIDAAVPAWVSDFGAWIGDKLAANDVESLLDYRARAPSAIRNQPTEEHLLPLFVAMGAAGTNAAATRLHASYDHGVLAMDAYTFD